MNTRKRHGSNYSHPESGSRGDGSRGQSGKSTDAAAAAGGHREVRSNRNNNRDDATTRDIGVRKMGNGISPHKYTTLQNMALERSNRFCSRYV